MKLIRGFLAYFTMVRLMERMLLRLGDLLVTSGSGPVDLEDLRTSGSLGRIVTLSSFLNLLLVLPSFFCHWLWPRSLRSTRCPTWKLGGSCPQSTPPAPQASRLTYSTHSHNTLRSLASLRCTFLRVCLLVWPLMQFLFSSLLNNQQSG